MIQKITFVCFFILLGFLQLIQAQSNNWNWAPAGPIYTAGRARNMIVDKNDASGKTLYAGSSASGVFKSLDGGKRWYPLDDQSSIRNISYLAQAYDGTIYVATGEGFLRLGQKEKAQAGTGLYKLVNDALVLMESSVNTGAVITRIACHPSLPYIALATNKGILVSRNGGPFNLAPDIPIGNLITGMDVKFDGSGLLYCSVGNETGAVIAGVNTNTVFGKVYRSVDASLVNFIDITPLASSLPANYGRIEIAIAPSNNNIVYVCCANKNTSFPGSLNFNSPDLIGLFVTYNATASRPNWALIQQFSSQIDPSSNGGTIASGDYALVLMVDTEDPEQLYIGSYGLYVYKRTGGSQNNPLGNWYNFGQSFFFPHQSYLHENIHDIKIVPGSPRKFYFVTDAGIYRSLDFADFAQGSLPSFQPFYKGLSTGQFNSVSIERFPLADNANETKPGSLVKPYSGFIGGTTGNGVVYYSGKDTVVTEEKSYLSDEIYNVEYSRIANGAVFISNSTGKLYRTTNARNTPPVLLKINRYSGNLSVVAPIAETFTNNGFTSGNPFRLWENYGQKKASPDSAIFYNDSSRVTTITVLTSTNLTTQKSFSFSIRRPGDNKVALVDSIVIRTATVAVETTPSLVTVPFTTGQDITISLKQNYTVSSTLTVISNSDLATTGPVDVNVPPVIKLNRKSLVDEISVTFSEAPFANKTQTSSTINYASYYKVFATVFYKYKVGDTVRVIDNNSISIKTYSYQTRLKKPLRWNYLTSLPVYTLTAPVQSSIPNPTFILTPGNITQTSPVFMVQPKVKTDYMITQTGSFNSTMTPVSYSISAIPINAYSISAAAISSITPLSYTLTATPNSGITNSSYSITPAIGVLSGTQSSSPSFTIAPVTPTSYTITQTGVGSPSLSYTYINSIGGYTYVLQPGNVAQSSSMFTVAPAILTQYAITQLGTSSAAAPVTYSSIGSTTYILNPGNIAQSNTLFIVTPTITTTYTLMTLSSNTLSVSNSITFVSLLSAKTTSSGIGTGTMVPLSPDNGFVKMPVEKSARLAFVLNNANTGNRFAVVVSKNALALNDPLNVVRVSQSGCYSDDSSGNPTTALINIPGKPTVLEWSKSGTELYFATDSNKLYRVSHITDIFDLSSTSYSGKFLTDVFSYPTNTINTLSPYRTTLIGSFDKPVTSISVSNDDQHLAITFHPAGTGTTVGVLYNSNDSRKSNLGNIGWLDKGSQLTQSISSIYCSMMEKDDSKKLFIGTDRGVFYSNDITSGIWMNVNTYASTGKLPSIQVFDIEQQTMDAWDCYNSGQIYVATNGRGIWTNSAFYTPYAVGISEVENVAVKKGELKIYPNPANEKVTLLFESSEGEHAILTVVDVTGRVVQEKDLGRINQGEVRQDIDVSDLKAGIYLVVINGQVNTKRAERLVIAR